MIRITVTLPDSNNAAIEAHGETPQRAARAISEALCTHLGRFGDERWSWGSLDDVLEATTDWEWPTRVEHVL